MSKSNSINQADWKKFLAGHWQREMPAKEGKYPTASHNGTQCAYIVVYLDPKDNVMKSYPKGWGGWWWSEPIPDMPKAPVIEGSK